MVGIQPTTTKNGKEPEKTIRYVRYREDNPVLVPPRSPPGAEAHEQGVPVGREAVLPEVRRTVAEISIPGLEVMVTLPFFSGIRQ